jgi:hypothetical protein
LFIHHTIKSIKLFRFIQRVEDGSAEALIGGEAAKFVGSDQDPEKMDLEKILSKFK